MKQEPIYCDACLATGKKTIGFKKVKLQHPITGKILIEQNFCEKCYLNFLQKMNAELDSKLAAERGKKGGQSGIGKSKRRGDSDYYSWLAKKRKKS
jgi:hypothetical protein